MNSHSSHNRNKNAFCANAFSFLVLILMINNGSAFTSPQTNVPTKASNTQRRVSQTSQIYNPSDAARIPSLSNDAEEIPGRRRFGGWSSSVRRKTQAAVNRLFPPRIGEEDEEKQESIDYERRKEEWASRYCSVDSLRETFGSNQNQLYGDLDRITTRRLYKTLLPRALLELIKIGVAEPEDLAPLAYQARVAAKLYARERSTLPTRLQATTFDAVRQFKKYGKFQPHGMSYDQIWDKYETRILEEDYDEKMMTEDDMTTKICLKILEKSCETNQRIDDWCCAIDDEECLRMKQEQTTDILIAMDQLEADVHALLSSQEDQGTISARRMFTLRLLARVRRRLELMI